MAARGPCYRAIVKLSARIVVALAPILLAVAVWALVPVAHPHYNVVFVTFDATRADHMGFLGGDRAATPMLDAMAARGTVFEEAITVQPLTLPSHTSLMTGLFPYHHGVRNNGTYVVGPDVVTLAERLHDVGYATHAVVSSFVLDSRFGLDQGFDSYDDDLSDGPAQKMFMFKEVPADRTAVRAIRLLRAPRDPQQPFFLWVHFFDPHADYTPPADMAAKFLGDPYTAEIAFADRELGRILAELDDQHVLDDTLFVFSADHGESLGEHGEATHGIFVYDATAHVPMLIAGPGVPVGGRVRDVVRTVDVVPTLLDLLGLPGGEALDGRSLADIWRGDQTPRVGYVEALAPRLNFGWSELRALRSDRTKAIDAPRAELYDVDADPHETRNRWDAGRSEPEAAALFADLAARKTADPFYQGTQGPAAMDAATREQLAALGYVWDPNAATEGARPDPKDRLPYWARFQGAQDMIRGGRYDEAIAALQSLLIEDPDNTTAMGSLALALAREHRTDEAIVVYAQMMSRDPARDTPYLASIRMLREAGRLDEAESLAKELVAAQPANADAAAAMGDVYTDRTAFPAAETWFRKALELEPTSSAASAGLGNCLNRAGRVKEAFEALSEAQARDPSDHGLTYNLAVVTAESGDEKGALALYERAVSLDPDHAMSWNNYGTVLEHLGRHAEAVAAVEKAHAVDPDCVEALYNLGAMRLGDGRAAEALPLLQEAGQRNPDMVPAIALTGDALVAVGRVDDAIATWTALAPRWPLAWVAIARVELDRGHLTEATAAVRTARTLGGSDVSAAIEGDDRLKSLGSPPAR